MCSVLTYLVEWNRLLRDRGHQENSMHLEEGEETFITQMSVYMYVKMWSVHLTTSCTASFSQAASATTTLRTITVHNF